MEKENWIKYRKCQMEECDYQEERGSRLGDFVDGKFVCPKHFEEFITQEILGKSVK